MKNAFDFKCKSLNFEKTVIFCVKSDMISLWIKGEWMI